MKKNKSKKEVSLVLDVGTGRILGAFTSNEKCIKALIELRTIALLKKSGRDFTRIDLPLNEIND